MKPGDDPTPDLYKIMDQAGLDVNSLLDSKKGMSQIVSEVRSKLARNLKSYVVRRDHQMFNAGAHNKEVKIDVQDISKD